MNWTRLAATLMGLTVLLHLFGGGPEVHAPLQAALTDPLLAAFAAVLWHAVTVVLAALAGGLWVLAQRRDPALEAILSGIQLGLAALFVFYGLTRLGTVKSWPRSSEHALGGDKWITCRLMGSSCPRWRSFVAHDERTSDAVGNSCARRLVQPIQAASAAGGNRVK